HAPARSLTRSRYAQEVEPLLDVLCAAFADRALRGLADGDDTLDPSQLVSSGAVGAEGAPLLERLVEMLAEDGVVQAAGDGRWRWASGASPLPDPADIWMSLIGDYPEYAGVTARVGSAGLHLAARLREGTGGEPREGAGADSALWWLEGATHEEAAGISDTLASLLDRVTALQRPEARVRILKIAGAAPREELARTLWRIPDRERCEVTIAAPSQRLLDEVRLRVPSLAGLSSRVLDLDRPAPPLSPDEEPGGLFDVVLLGEGFADAPDPSVRLANVRRLLNDGGLLIGIEQHPSRAADLVFGPGLRWRPAGGWSASVRHAGFEEWQAICDAPSAGSGPYVFIARAALAPAQSEPRPRAPRPRGTWLVVHDGVGASAELAAAVSAELERRHQRIVSVVPGAEYGAERSRVRLDPTSSAQWSRLLTELERTGAAPEGWVHLAGLDLGSASAPPAARLSLQRSRAEVLIAWLQACARSPLRPGCFVVAAHAGLELLPPSVVPPSGGAPPDRLRDAALWGLSRVAMQELAELKVRWLDLASPLPAPSSAPRLVEELLNPDSEDEIVLTSEGRFVPRLESGVDYTRRPRAGAAEAARGPWQLDFLLPGPFRNLRWQRREPPAPLPAGEIEIEVRATGLNFRDVMYAMGLLPDEAVENGFCGPALGMELAGVVAAVGAEVSELAVGDEVMAIAPGAFATRVRTPAWAAARKPAGWSMTAAATVPAVFFTAWYALVELARLREGERLLIHGAAGGVGIAALQIARHLKAEVFATAGSPLKRDFVTLLGADRVFDSRSLTFADEIREATAGEGVDVVLNSLAGEAMRRSVALLKPFGRMLELGKRDFYENSRLGLRPFRNNIAYFGID
ncbi:MAG TPA: zinc-binding dehydrogenase, partial [Verrucomicrobiae bacterium]|nr:zinc-binding dehydrogenase [Verrucomicrobiae bacterium]